VFTVGQFGTLKPQRLFRGMLNELAIYNRALSEVEVSEHYWMMISDSNQIGDVRAHFADTA
jgi:hypothetical protein